MAVQDLRRCIRFLAFTSGLLATLSPSTVSAQNGSGGLPPAAEGASSYEQRYAELMAVQALPNATAPVSWLVLNRDVARFTFESGNFHLLTPVGGRTVGAVFWERGSFRSLHPAASSRIVWFVFGRPARCRCLSPA